MADARAGGGRGRAARGPLRGVPVMLKDLGQKIAGVRQTDGARARCSITVAGARQRDDARATARLGWCSSARPARPSSATTRRPSPRRTGRVATRGTSTRTAGGSSGGSAVGGGGRDGRCRRAERRRRLDPDSGVVLRAVRAQADAIADLVRRRPVGDPLFGLAVHARGHALGARQRSAARHRRRRRRWAIPTSRPLPAGPISTRSAPIRGGCGSAGRRPPPTGGAVDAEVRGGHRGDRARCWPISATRSSRPRPTVDPAVLLDDLLTLWAVGNAQGHAALVRELGPSHSIATSSS